MERNWILIVAGIFLFLVGAWLTAGGPLPGTADAVGHQLNGLQRLVGLVPAALGALIGFSAFPPGRK